ncbi:MAG: 2-oxo acid dehydrogenase subunit E2 [Flavobacteriaceae bacterium]|nr:2-oxo acid dehydrogenase subunit E2 [Flavobacteriaceae bacterium]
MAIIITMPRLSDTMNEGVVAKWHAKIGDQINEGMLLAEIETDKATMDFEAFPGQEGVLLYIGVQESQTAPVDAILAILGAAGEDVSALVAGGTTAAKADASPAEEPASAPATDPAPVIQGASVPAQPAATPIETSTMNASAPSDARLKASPLARSLASQHGLSIASIPGTGDGGRITKSDVERSLNSASVEPNTVSAAAVSYPSSGYVDTPVSQMRKTIAKRLAESKFTAPHFYLTIAVDMSAATAARAEINKDGDVKISYNDLVVKSVAKALKKHPAVNSAWMGDSVRTNFDVHVGIAVAVEDGLLVPVVRHADAKGLAEISAEVRGFAMKAKEKKLQPSDWSGNTFTISNLGMFGIEEFTAIINPPDAAILAIGGVQDVPVVKNGQVQAGQVMKMTLSCDHRVIDGVTGAAFLNTVKGYLERPLSLIL